MPPGFPKGQTAYTSAKVIVARSFPPPGLTYRYAKRPFDPVESEHGTHVAGHRGRRPRHDGRGRLRPGDRVRDRAARIPRQLPHRDDPDERRRSRRQLTRDRGGDRAGREGRDERDQHLVRRAGHDAVARHRRPGDRRSRRRWQSCRWSRPETTSTRSASAPLDLRPRRRRPSRSPPRRRAARSPTSRLPGRRRTRCSSSPTSPPRESRSSRRCRATSGSGTRSTARAWPHRTSPARPRCSCSGIPAGRSRRSSPR